MTEKDVLERLKRLEDEMDTEEAHVQADELLCAFLRDLGYASIVDAYEDIYKWYA